MNPLTWLKFRARAKKIPGPTLIDPGMSHFYPQDPATSRSVRAGDAARLLQNAPFCPISASGSHFNPRNTQCIPVVKIFAFLELEQK